MPILATCPACQSEFRLRNEMAGVQMRCPNCQAIMQAPAATPKAVGSPEPTPPSLPPVVSSSPAAPARPAAVGGQASIPISASLLAGRDDPLGLTPRPRPRAEPEGKPVWMIVALTAGLVTAIGIVGILGVLVIRAALWGDSSSADRIAAWTPEPSRAASFTSELSIDRCVLRSPEGLTEVPLQYEGLANGVRVEARAWSDLSGGNLANLTVRVMVFTAVDPELPDAQTTAERSGRFIDQLIPTLGWTYDKRSTIEELNLGGLPFYLVRFELPLGQFLRWSDREERKLHALLAVHVENRRAIVLEGLSKDPPGSENYRSLEAMLSTFTERFDQ